MDYQNLTPEEQDQVKRAGELPFRFPPDPKQEEPGTHIGHVAYSTFKVHLISSTQVEAPVYVWDQGEWQYHSPDIVLALVSVPGLDAHAYLSLEGLVFWIQNMAPHHPEVLARMLTKDCWQQAELVQCKKEAQEHAEKLQQAAEYIRLAREKEEIDRLSQKRTASHTRSQPPKSGSQPKSGSEPSLDDLDLDNLDI